MVSKMKKLFLIKLFRRSITDPAGVILIPVHVEWNRWMFFIVSRGFMSFLSGATHTRYGME